MNELMIRECFGGEHEVPLSALLQKDGSVFLSGSVDAAMADNFVRLVLYYETTGFSGPVNIYINSPGGEVNAGLTIIDAMKNSSLTFHTIVTGRACSMAAWILAAAPRGNRHGFPHAQVMIHEPLLAGGVGGSASSIRELSESILRTRDTMNGLMAEYTGKTVEEINRATAFDNYMNIEEAIRLGLCDSVLDRMSV